MSLSQKFSFWIISILLLIGLLSTYLYYKSEMRNEAMRIEALANTIGPILEQSLANHMLRRDTDALERTLDNLKGIKPISRIWLINRSGVIKASSNKGEMERALSYGDAGCKGCHEKGLRGLFLKSEGIFRWVQPVGNKSECYKCHDPSNKINGVFIIDFSTAELSRYVTKHMYRGLLILLLSLACISLALIVLSKTFVIKRLNGVIDKIRKFKEGDYNPRMLLNGNDEITRLEENFNEMADAMTEREKERDMLFKQVSRSYEQWQRTFDSITELISIIDTEGNIVRANRTFIEYFGVTQEELREKKCLELFYGKNAPEKSFAGKATGIYYKEEEIVDKDGRTFWVSTFPYSYPEADFHGSILVARDITERKKMEGEREELIRELETAVSKISRSHKEWQDTFDNITDLVFIHDRDFNVVRANRAFAEYFGLTPREVINKKCHELFYGSDSPAAECPSDTGSNMDHPVTREIHIPKTNRVFSISSFPYYSLEREMQCSICIAKDISEEKEKEMRLIMSERLAALGQMASGVAHEINNPLAAIMGCAEGLLARVKRGQFNPELFENYLGIIEEEISRCKNITTGMLSFVRKTTYEKREINVNEDLDKTLEIISFQGRLKNVEVVRNYMPGIPIIHGNEGELRQTFMAIITNALDAMKDNGTLKLETGAEAETVSITISDSGPGIPAEAIGRIFDPFFTTKSETGGTGLGLSIAGKIINNHKGSIQVSTEQGKETTFKIILPLR